MQRLSETSWPIFLIMMCLSIAFGAEDDVSEVTHRAIGRDFRKFARSQMQFLQEGVSSGEGMEFDVELVGKLKESIDAFDGHPGLPGPIGATGEKGPVGYAGVAGQQGPNGEVGPVGPASTVQGAKGITGDEGDVGNTGPEGKQGPQGLQGIPGQKGRIGEEGLIGTKLGIKGLVGDMGHKGAVGKIGLTGLTGDRGKTGDAGTCGGEGMAGLPGATGDEGERGAAGPDGFKGPKGAQGIQGAAGNTGKQGATGAQGHKGNEGPEGLLGLAGPLGKEGDTGKEGPEGPAGEEGPQGLVGDKGVVGVPGPKGATGPHGKDGFPGKTGPDGVTGMKGNKGPKGMTGDTGPHGAEGPAGESGGIGEKGPDFAYSIDGPEKFTAGLGGDKGAIYTKQSGMFFEHSENPGQIRFVQKTAQEGKSTEPAIVSGYNGNVGIGTETGERELHIKNICAEADELCANNKGPLIMSASWRNVLMSKVGTVHHDMIGSYANWAQGKSAVYIGAYDEGGRPVTQPLGRVVFGGDPQNTDGVARFENSVGKFYANQFVVKNAPNEITENILSDATTFLEVVETATSVNMGHHHLALHAKTAQHQSKLAEMEAEVASLIAKAKAIKKTRMT